MDKSTKFWNKSAAQFEKSDNPKSPARQETYTQIRKHISKNHEVLDFGCATGSLCIEFANEVKSIHGIDISDQMILIAQQKINDLGLNNVQLHFGSLSDKEMKDQKYDIILAFYVIHLVQDPKATLKQLLEHLKPDGKIIMEVPCLKEQKGFKAWLTRTFSKLFGLPYLHHFDYQSISKIANSIHAERIEHIEIKEPIARNFLVLKK